MFDEQLETTLAALGKTKAITYGCCSIEGSIYEDSLDDGGVQRSWIISCMSSAWEICEKGQFVECGVDIEITIDIEDDGRLLVHEYNMAIGGKLVSEGHKKNIQGMVKERLQKLQPNTTEYIEEVLWLLVKFIERGMGK